MPEANIRIVLAMVDEMLKQNKEETPAKKASATSQDKAVLALKRLQMEMDGVGEAVGLNSDEAVAEWVMESRRKERMAP